MKKYLFIVILALLIIGSASCFGSGGSESLDLGGFSGGDYEPYLDSYEDIEGALVDPFEILPYLPIDTPISSIGEYIYKIDVRPSSKISDDISPHNDYFQLQPGQISASALDDHEYYAEWLESILKEDSSLYRLYNQFTSTAQNLYTDQMVTLKVVNSDDLPIENVKVSLMSSEDKEFFKSSTDAFGIAYLFADFKSLDEIKVKLTYNGESQIQTFAKSQIENDFIQAVLDAELPTSKKVLDLALIIDTTGSMGDEIRYMKTELQDVLERIAGLNVDINLALIFYRDEGDTYVTKTYDFTSNLGSQYQYLSEQTANGGGDYEEAVHKALMKACELNWSENSTKLIIHVCDAPIHNEEEIVKSFSDSVLELTDLGVKMIPVICSGSDSFCELIFREAALYTGGTYTYITNHSGIGNSHAEPETSLDLTVEYLNKMLERLIKQYVTGQKYAPEPYYKDNAYQIIVHVKVNGEDKIMILLSSINEEITISELLEEYQLEEGDIVLIDGENEVQISLDTIIQSNLELKMLKEIIEDITDPIDEEIDSGE